MTSMLLISRTGPAPSGRGPGAGRAPDSSTCCANGSSLLLDLDRVFDLLPLAALDLVQRGREQTGVVGGAEGDRVRHAGLEVLDLLQGRLDGRAVERAALGQGALDALGHDRHRVPPLDVTLALGGGVGVLGLEVAVD